MERKHKYEAIVIGTSAGGLNALTTLLKVLPAEYPLPIIVVQHRAKDQRTLLEEILQQKCRMRVKQADEKESILGGTVYIAPPDYHLLLEENRTFSLSFDEPVIYSRPSIDVLFESAAVAYGDRLIGIVLSGASADGADGMTVIKKHGGRTIVQNPSEADFAVMPRASLDTRKIDHVWKLDEIGNFLRTLITPKDGK